MGEEVSEEKKQLGKIQKCEFGFGGYNDGMIGMKFTLGGDGWGVMDFWGHWQDWSERCKWTEAEQKTGLGEITLRVRDLLRAAKVDHVSQLIGIPVECTFHNFNVLKEWRVLTEVL